MTTKLHQLLDEAARFDVEFHGGLSNHLPMALGALAALGASDSHLERYFEGYAPKLDAAPPAQAWPAGDAWVSRFGDRAAWPAYRDLFAQWLGHEDRASVLAQVLPQLMPGCGAAAFHGLIRTAYAVNAQHDGELADALAYWSRAFMRMPTVPPGEGTTADLDEALAALPAVGKEAPLISARLRVALATPGMPAAVAAWRVDEHSQQALARHAALLYAASGDFTVLHLVTSAHAVRELLPFVDEPLPALRHYWQAYAAGWAASGAQRGTAAAPMPWAELVDAALASEDEHLIKLVHSCREHERVYGGDEWQLAAARAVRDAA